MFQNIKFQDPCTPVMEAIVEVHSYIMFFLCAIVTFVLVALACVIYQFYRRGWWWTSLGGSILLVVLRLGTAEVVSWTLLVGCALLLVRFTGVSWRWSLLGVGVGVFANAGEALAVEDNEQPLPEEEAPEWQRNGYPSEAAFEEAVDQREKLLWILIVAGALFILTAAIAFFYFGGTPPPGREPNLDGPPAGGGLELPPPRETSPAVLQAQPPS